MTQQWNVKLNRLYPPSVWNTGQCQISPTHFDSCYQWDKHDWPVHQDHNKWSSVLMTFSVAFHPRAEAAMQAVNPFIRELTVTLYTDWGILTLMSHKKYIYWLNLKIWLAVRLLSRCGSKCDLLRQLRGSAGSQRLSTCQVSLVFGLRG